MVHPSTEDGGNPAFAQRGWFVPNATGGEKTNHFRGVEMSYCCAEAEQRRAQGRDFMQVGNPQIMNEQQTTRTLAEFPQNAQCAGRGQISNPSLFLFLLKRLEATPFKVRGVLDRDDVAFF
jgi:hypothetical protein